MNQSHPGGSVFSIGSHVAHVACEANFCGLPCEYVVGPGHRGRPPIAGVNGVAGTTGTFDVG